MMTLCKNETVRLGQTLVASVRVLAFLTLVLGIGYPLATTLLAQRLFPDQANGSLIVEEGRVVGSALIGQSFEGTAYFRSRPSAAGYDPMASGGTNDGPSSEALLRRATLEARRLRESTGSAAPVPADLITSSASGLDPHISFAAAVYQIPAVAKNTGLTAARLRELVRTHEIRGLFGSPSYVNVLQLNLDVRRLLSARAAPRAGDTIGANRIDSQHADQ